MPRGVYDRGQQKPAKAAAPAPIAPTPVAAPAAQADPVTSLAPEGIRKSASKDVESLSGDDLRAYARSVGVSPRNCAELTEDRLRQNVKLVIQQTYELLTE
jgi:hypothetical protein